MLTVRPATQADFHALYGEAPARTIRAEVAELDGVPVAIAGIAYGGERPLLFSRILPALRPHKRFIVRQARRFAEIARKAHAVAIADCQSTASARLLQAVGAQKVGESEQGEVFAWRQPLSQRP